MGFSSSEVSRVKTSLSGAPALANDDGPGITQRVLGSFTVKRGISHVNANCR